MPHVSATTTLPSVFIGHGSPMNTLESNRYTLAWQQLGQRLRRPRAILCVSAHWYTRGTAVTAMAQPKTIHDFGGFPQALFDVQYPAPGDPKLAARVKDLLTPTQVGEDFSAWGLDHGTWSVLKHVYPNADIPVVQLSIDGTQPPAYHYNLAKRLSPLRDDDVLIVGSGNVVHNLSTALRQPSAPPYPWATRFDALVRSHLQSNQHTPLMDLESLGEDATRSVPTLEHYLPLLYIIGLQRPNEKVTFLTDGIDLGSISMMSVAVGDF